MIKKLSQMKIKESGKIIKIGDVSEDNLRKLLSLDLAPNSLIAIVLREPTLVVKGSFSEVAIDHFLADQIQVEVNP